MGDWKRERLRCVARYLRGEHFCRAIAGHWQWRGMKLLIRKDIAPDVVLERIGSRRLSDAQWRAYDASERASLLAVAIIDNAWKISFQESDQMMLVPGEG